MTAPDHEPICGPSCDPMICHAGHCALEQANEHALRNKVRDTIHAASPTCTDYHAADCLPCTARAWLVMRLAVQPVLDAKDAEIRKWQLAYNGANAMARVGKVHLKRLWETRDQLKAAEQRAEEAEERADQAEEIAGIARDTSNRSEAERARAVQRAEAAERELAALRTHQQTGDL